MKKIFLFALLFCVLLIASGLAQVPDTVWSKYISQGLSKRINTIKFSTDDNHLLVAGGSQLDTYIVNQFMYLIDNSSGTITQSYNVEHPVLLADFTPTGDTIITLESDNKIKLYSTDSGQVLKTISQDLLINSIALSPDGKKIFFTETQGFYAQQFYNAYDTINVWNIANDSIERRIPIVQTVGNLAVNPSNSYLLYNRGYSLYKNHYTDEIHLYNFIDSTDTLLGSHNSFVNFQYFSENGNRSISTSLDLHYILWNIQNKSKILDSVLVNGIVRHAIFSQNSNYLIIADTLLNVLELDSLTLKYSYDTNQVKGWIVYISCSHDGNHFAVATYSMSDVKFYVYLLNAKYQSSLFKIEPIKDGKFLFREKYIFYS